MQADEMFFPYGKTTSYTFDFNKKIQFTISACNYSIDNFNAKNNAAVLEKNRIGKRLILKI